MHVSWFVSARRFSVPTTVNRIAKTSSRSRYSFCIALCGCVVSLKNYTRHTFGNPDTSEDLSCPVCISSSVPFRSKHSFLQSVFPPSLSFRVCLLAVATHFTLTQAGGDREDAGGRHVSMGSSEYCLNCATSRAHYCILYICLVGVVQSQFGFNAMVASGNYCVN